MADSSNETSGKLRNTPSRRHILKQISSAGALGAAAALASPNIARAQCAGTDWGAIVGNVGLSGSPWTCANHDGYKILEIYQYLGASHWEALWLPGNGTGPNLTDHGMGSLALSGLSWNADPATFPCEPPDIPGNFNDSQLFAPDSDGMNIYWGAAAKPLYQRADIISRTRMITQYHELFPHQAAIPFCLSGLTLGNPRRAGTGAAVQRRDRVENPSQLLPVSYVIHNGATIAVDHAAISGTHPGYARPLVIRVQNNDNFYAALSRSNVSPESDDLLASLRHEFRDRMRFRGGGNPVRSDGFDGYWLASELLEQAPSLQSLFADQILEIDNNVATCATHATIPAQGNAPAAKTMIHAAASLLSSGPAKYVCVMDNGVSGTYDTHDIGHLVRTNNNYYNVFHHLADVINHATNPSGTINLDDTMIIINTEFSRTHNVNGSTGRDHWPVGYATTMIGGPINGGGSSILGAIDTGTGYTKNSYRYTPADIRGALLLAAGVDPFADGNFRVSDFSAVMQSGGAGEEQIRNRLRDDILGV